MSNFEKDQFELHHLSMTDIMEERFDPEHAVDPFKGKQMEVQDPVQVLKDHLSAEQENSSI